MIAFSLLTLQLLSSASVAQDPPVPPVILRSEAFSPERTAVIHVGACGADAFSVRIETDDPIAPRITVARGDAIQSFDRSEPFVRDLFFGQRYDLVQVTCHGDGLRLLALMHASRDDAPLYLVGSVYFDANLRVSQYDGLGSDPPDVIERYDLGYYDRLLACREVDADPEAIRDCVRASEPE